MKRLSHDALWLWHTLDDLGLDTLKDDELCEYLADEETWSESRLQAARAELEERGILSRKDGQLLGAPIERGTGAVKDGVLISVTVKVFSSTEVEIGAIRGESKLVDEIEGALVDSGRPNTSQAKRAIYWCTTDDGDEDWFVVAPSASLARSFHEDSEGYDSGTATAEWVVDVPDLLTTKESPQCEWPRDDFLRACGGEFLPFQADTAPEKVTLRKRMGVQPRAVRFGDRIFVAGDVVENVARRQRKPGPSMDN